MRVYPASLSVRPTSSRPRHIPLDGKKVIAEGVEWLEVGVLLLLHHVFERFVIAHHAAENATKTITTRRTLPALTHHNAAHAPITSPIDTGEPRDRRRRQRTRKRHARRFCETRQHRPYIVNRPATERA